MNANSYSKEIIVIFKEKDISIKISIRDNESVISTRKKLENILGIDINSNYDIFIKDFYIGDFYNEISTDILLNSFCTNEIEIKKKFDIPKHSINIRNVTKTMDEVAMKSFYLSNLFKTERDITTTYFELELLEENLRNYEKEFEKTHISMNLSLSSFLNRGSDYESTAGIIVYLYR